MAAFDLIIKNVSISQSRNLLRCMIEALEKLKIQRNSQLIGSAFSGAGQRPTAKGKRYSAKDGDNGSVP